MTPPGEAASRGSETLDRPALSPATGGHPSLRLPAIGAGRGGGASRRKPARGGDRPCFSRRALAFAFSLGFGIDEAYTVPISRDLRLSYFDHPPLHQWITHFAALASGEGIGARLPFVALFAATGWLLYRLTSELFGPRAGLIALFALNATPFFFASAGTWIMPDGPLLFGLALAAFALARLFFDPGGDERRVWRLWLLAGLGFGLAGLSKYTGALAPLGLLAFLAISPSERRWFRHPAPYVAATLAGLIVLPVFVWNAQHGWASFVFQGSRGLASGGLKPLEVLRVALGQIAFLSPWLFVPLVAGLVSGLRRWRDDRRLFLLCLSLPPIALFTAAPLWIEKGQPHWAMAGWFFAFPLMGAWAQDLPVPVQDPPPLRHSIRRPARGADRGRGRRGANRLAMAPLARRDDRPDAGSPRLERSRQRSASSAPAAFRHLHPLAGCWQDRAGAWADVPVFVVSDDPRGWTFMKGARSW